MRRPAVVEEVPQVVVTRQLRPQDPGRPTDSGVVQVKLALQSPAPLKLGQRVETPSAGPAGTGRGSHKRTGGTAFSAVQGTSNENLAIPCHLTCTVFCTGGTPCHGNASRQRRRWRSTTRRRRGR